MTNQPNSTRCGSGDNPHANLSTDHILPKYGFRMDFQVSCGGKNYLCNHEMGYFNFEPYLSKSQLTEWSEQQVEDAKTKYDVNNVFILLLNVTPFLKD